MRALLILALSLPALAMAQSRPLNDTGITFCGDDTVNTVDCGTVAADFGTHPRQDARFGRDAFMVTKVGTGRVGFDFTKISNLGADLPVSASAGSGGGDWGCTRDNVTGLVWEIKTSDGGLRDRNGIFTNFDDPARRQVVTYPYLTTYPPSQAQIDASTNSIGYVNSVNAQGLCGSSDWRRPSVKELESIMDYGLAAPYLDPMFFPDMPTATWLHFISRTPSAEADQDAWVVSFDHGSAGRSYARIFSTYLRLVRGGL